MVTRLGSPEPPGAVRYAQARLQPSVDVVSSRSLTARAAMPSSSGALMTGQSSKGLAAANGLGSPDRNVRDMGGTGIVGAEAAGWEVTGSLELRGSPTTRH